MVKTDTSTEEGLVMISLRQGCPHCDKLLKLLEKYDIYPQVVYAEDILPMFTVKHKTVPQLYYKGKYKGDSVTIHSMANLTDNFKERLLE